MIASILTLGLGLSSAPPMEPLALEGEKVAIRASRVEVGDGSSIEDALILIEDGTIVSVTSGGEAPGDAAYFEHHGVVSPGMIACRSYHGLRGGSIDTTRALLPTANVVDSLDRNHSSLRIARDAGITSLVIAPRPTTIAGGTTAVIKTHGGAVEREHAHLALSIGDGALDANRLPTSVGGAIRALDAHFEAGEGVFGAARSGEMSILIDAPARDDVARAAALAQRHMLSGAIRGASWGGEMIEVIQGSGLHVILAPLGPGTARRTLNSVAAMAEAGIAYGFALDGPGHAPGDLRFSAAMALRAGASRESAVRSLFANAAAIAGVSASAGKVAPGMDADLVFWSGDPLDLASSVDGVWVDGEHVYERDGYGDDDEEEDDA